MQLKTDRINFDGTDSEKINRLINYTETLRDEIDFRLSSLKEKQDAIYEILRKIQGGAK